MVDKRRNELYDLLGCLPPRNRPVSAELMALHQEKDWTLETLALDLNGEELVPAFFIRPNTPGPHPTILYNHYHGGQYQVGKNEFMTPGDYMVSPYGPELAKRGYAALCIDHMNFGARSGRSEHALYKALLWKGKVLWGLMVHDSLKALDYLCSRQDVDANRLGTLGLSMGSTMAWWVSALDERVKVCIDLCCMTDFDSLLAHGEEGINGHNFYYYVPGLLKHFTTAQINALIHPRAHLSLNGKYDVLTPYDGLIKIDVALKEVYKDCPDKWRMVIEPHGHMETPSMRKAVLEFLHEHL